MDLSKTGALVVTRTSTEQGQLEAGKGKLWREGGLGKPVLGGELRQCGRDEGEY